MARAHLVLGVLFFLTVISRAADPPADDGAALYRYLTHASQAAGQLEFVQMYRAVSGGSRMGPGDGWFKPSQSRYDWKWLAARCDADKDGKITPVELGRSPVLFAGLDRDRDGTITAGDLDWSDSSPFLRQLQQARQMFGPWDSDRNQKISKQEWDALFQKLAQGKENLDDVDLAKLLRPPTPGASATPQAAKPPSKKLLLERLWTGELGSPFAGPNVGDPAPEFSLKTHDGKKKIALLQYRYKKPVVLIFGSFT